jgi:hypothetical protein
MKALSLVQPWAWLAIHGGMTIENRSWSTSYRGRLLIHASAKLTAETLYRARAWVHETIGLEAALPIPFLGGELRLGGIIGAVTLVDVLRPTGMPTRRWHMPGAYGFVLADPEPLPFRACKGTGNMWGRFVIRDGLVVEVTA